MLRTGLEVLQEGPETELRHGAVGSGMKLRLELNYERHRPVVVSTKCPNILADCLQPEHERLGQAVLSFVSVAELGRVSRICKSAQARLLAWGQVWDTVGANTLAALYGMGGLLLEGGGMKGREGVRRRVELRQPARAGLGGWRELAGEEMEGQ